MRKAIGVIQRPLIITPAQTFPRVKIVAMPQTEGANFLPKEPKHGPKSRVIRKPKNPLETTSDKTQQRFGDSGITALICKSNLAVLIAVSYGYGNNAEITKLYNATPSRISNSIDTLLAAEMISSTKFVRGDIRPCRLTEKGKEFIDLIKSWHEKYFADCAAWIRSHKRSERLEQK